jgi:hypothetical protein
VCRYRTFVPQLLRAHVRGHHAVVVLCYLNGV